MANGFKGITNGIRIVPGTTSGSVLGDMRVDSTSSLPMFYNGSREISMLTSSSRYNVKDYGAKGDGITDDSSAINSAITAASSGGVIYFPSGNYLCNSDIDCSVSATWILGEGNSSKILFADGKRLEITVSNVKVSNLWFDGQNYSTGTSTGRIIMATGTVSSYIENIQVVDCKVTNVPLIGIDLSFVENFKILNNYIENVYNAGIILRSCQYGEINNNTIIDIQKDSLVVGDVYGIAVTRSEGSLASHPRSKGIVVSNNVIHNNPTWEGLDTHCGEDITFSNNVITACKLGIVVGSDGNVPSEFPPSRVVVSGNVIDSQVTDGSASYGIVVVGDSDETDFANNCIVTGNSVSRYGAESSSTGCAMYFYSTRGLVVSGNSIIEAGANAIYLSLNNSGFVIVDNIITDVFSNTIGRATGIYSQSNSQTGLIQGNVFTTGTKSATSVMTQAMNFLNTRTGYDIIIGQNYWAGTAATYLADAPSGVAGGRLIAGGSPSYQFTNASAQNTLIYNANDNSGIIVASGSSSTKGRNTLLYSSGHTTSANILQLRRGSIVDFAINNSGECTLGSTGSAAAHVINGYVVQNYNGAGEQYYLSSNNTGFFCASGGNGSTSGKNLFLYSSGHASLPNVLQMRQGSAVQFQIASGGVITLGSTSSTAQHVINGLTATTATAGTVHTVPTTAVEYLTITVNGSTRKIPLFAS